MTSSFMVTQIWEAIRREGMHNVELQQLVVEQELGIAHLSTLLAHKSSPQRLPTSTGNMHISRPWSQQWRH